MRLSEADDPQAWVTSAFESPAHHLHPLLGTHGYQLPQIEGLIWMRASECTVSGITVVQTGDAKHNWLAVDPAYQPVGKFSIRYLHNCRNNVIVIAKDSKTVGDYLFHGRGSLVILCENAQQYSPLYSQIYSNDMLLYWGKNSTTNGLHVQLLGDGKRCVVGEDCMFSSGIYIRNSDIHAIMDAKTGEHRNPPSDILIEPHVWVGQDAYIGRKARLGFCSIIGAKSVVTKEVPRWVTMAGVPATIVARETTWDRLPEPRLKTLADLRVMETKLA